MYVGKKDNIVNVKDNRIVRDKLRTVVSYNEYDLDHLSFLLAKNMSFFDNVLEQVKSYNPIDPAITVLEKQMKKADDKI